MRARRRDLARGRLGCKRARAVMTRRIRTRRVSRLLVVALGCALAVTGCAGQPRHVQATPQPPRVPGEITSAPDLSGVQLPNFIMPLIDGGVSFPKKALTPGVVTTTDTNTV